MKSNRLITLSMLILSAQVYGQDEVIIPWLTNSPQFKGTIIVNNLNDTTAEVFLVATRNNGQEEPAIRTIPPFGQLVESSSTLFPILGEGPGYRVIITGNVPLRAGFVISSTGSPSGDSPAQADAVTLEAASNSLIFNYLPITPDSGASAPVVVNSGDSDATVVLHAWQAGTRVASSDAFTLAPGRPFADITSNLFPEVEGDVFVIAESDQPLLGMTFIFNGSLEPSMANANPLSTPPQPLKIKTP